MDHGTIIFISTQRAQSHGVLAPGFQIEEREEKKTHPVVAHYNSDLPYISAKKIWCYPYCLIKLNAAKPKEM